MKTGFLSKKLIIILLSIFITSIIYSKEAKVITYPAPKGETPSLDYNIKVNDNQVFVVEVNGWHNALYLFANEIEKNPPKPGAVLISTKVNSGEIIKIGTAVVDISPKNPIWLVGYASRKKPSEGIEHPIYAKAIAFEDSDGLKAVLVATDLLGFHRELANEIADRVKNELGIPRANLMLTSTHTHAAPILYRTPINMFDLSDKEWQTVAEYTQFLKNALFEVIKNSLLDLSPGSLMFGKGNSDVAKNRRVVAKDKVSMSENPAGPVDSEVPVLVVRDSGGNQKAILFGYACHGTTLTGDNYLVCGDFMGFTQKYLEIAQPGTTTLFVAGCGADANPSPRGTMNDARINGMSLAGAVTDVLRKKMKPVSGLINCEYQLIDLEFAKIPTANELEERLNSENPHERRRARYFLNILEKDGKIPRTYSYPIQVWKIGDGLTMVSLGGEVVVDYALRLKKELPAENLWTIAYANDVCGYIGSKRILNEGGYEADASTVYYNLPSRWANDVEERIISAVEEIIKKMQN